MPFLRNFFRPTSRFDNFLNQQEWIPVASTNIELAQYDHTNETLRIQYKGGAVYAYSNVSSREALDFAQAGSKGEWVWDHLRIRGTRTGHKKPYRLEAFQ